MKHQVHILVAMLVLTLVGGIGCADLKDGLPPPVAPGAQVHLPSWVDTSAGNANFHGRFANSEIGSCLKCHGSDYNGGTSKISCIKCHNTTGANIHGRGWEDLTSPNFHGKYLQSQNWDMRPCQPCHGETYAGGTVPSSCRTCHTGGAGPENCATCHGSATSIAPPRDLRGGTSRTLRGVGAHQIHVLGSSIATGISCGDCHVVPGPTYAPGHIDNSPNAEVLINSAIARVETNKPGTPNYSPSLPRFSPSPVYDATTLKCSSTYCHGNFKNGNTTFAPVWNDATGSQMACGTCHGDVAASTALLKALPKTPAQGGTHPTIPAGWTCANCHGEVVNSSTQIINPTKHMNGKLNIGPNEIDY